MTDLGQRQSLLQTQRLEQRTRFSFIRQLEVLEVNCGIVTQVERRILVASFSAASSGVHEVSSAMRKTFMHVP